MPPRPDPQSFTKFALSAGVFCLIAAFVVPGLILRETGVLRISRHELMGFTPLARSELQRRQRIERFAGLAAPYVGGFFLILGGGLIAYGVPRLKRQEEADEERFSVELDKLRLEVKPQSEGEREERLKEDVEEELVYEKPSPLAEVPTTQPPSSRPQSSFLPMQDLHRRIRRAGDVEQRVLAHIAQIALPSYELQANVKIEGTTTLLLDGLLVSKSEQIPDIVVEIKLSGRSLRNNMRNRIDHGAAQLTIYRARLKRKAIGWLILVSEEAISPADHEFIMRVAADFASDLRISAITLDDLPGLPLPPPDEPMP